MTDSLQEYTAEQSGDRQILRPFFSTGVDTSDTTLPRMLNIGYNSHGKPPPNVKKLVEAIRDDNESQGKFLLQSLHADDLNSDYYGAPPLVSVAASGKQELLVDLVRAGACNWVGNGSTALYASCVNGHTECVRLLLQMGANPQLKGTVDGYDQFILHDTIKKGPFECVKLLITALPEATAKLFVNERNWTGDWEPVLGEVTGYPLYYAFRSGKAASMKLLIDYGADFQLAFPGKDEKDLMCIAARAGYLDIVRFFIERGVDSKACYKDGPKTALDLARITRQQDVIDFLQSLDVPTDDTIVFKDRSKEAVEVLATSFSSIPMHFTPKSGFSSLDECFHALLPEHSNLPLREGTLLHYLASHATKETPDIGAYIEKLITMGADIQVKNSKGSTPYMIAETCSLRYCSDRQREQRNRIVSLLTTPEEQEALLNDDQLVFSKKVSQTLLREIEHCYGRQKLLDELKKNSLNLVYDKEIQAKLAREIKEGSCINHLLPGSLSHLSTEDLLELSEEISQGETEIGFITDESEKKEAVCLQFMTQLDIRIGTETVNQNMYLFKNVSDVSVFEAWLKESPKSLQFLKESGFTPCEKKCRLQLDEHLPWDSDPLEICKKLLKEQIGITEEAVSEENRCSDSITFRDHHEYSVTDKSSYPVQHRIIQKKRLAITHLNSQRFRLDPQYQSHFPHFTLQKKADGLLCVTEFYLTHAWY